MENKNGVLVGLAAILLLSSFKSSETGGEETPTNTNNSATNGTSFIGKTNLAKGLRNNNPLNIHTSSRQYKGKLKPVEKDSDGKYLERFETFEHGLAAAIEHLQKRYFGGELGALKNCYGWDMPAKYKRDNLLKIIYTWVCGSNPSAYIEFVERTTGFTRTQTLDLNDNQTLSVLIYAMSLYECGTQYKDSVLSPSKFQKYFQTALTL